MSSIPTLGPLSDGDATTDSSDSLVVIFDGHGDTTRRPRPPSIPREWTRPASAEKRPSPDQPHTDQPSS